jgi:hypothetical protein
MGGANVRPSKYSPLRPFWSIGGTSRLKVILDEQCGGDEFVSFPI